MPASASECNDMSVISDHVTGKMCIRDRAYYGDGAEHMSQVQREAAREKLGLDDSMPVQYARWAAHLFDGDLGLSYKYKQPVTEVIGKVWVNTLILGGVSYVPVSYTHLDVYKRQVLSVKNTGWG